jgi:hypothetical protein
MVESSPPVTIRGGGATRATVEASSFAASTSTAGRRGIAASGVVRMATRARGTDSLSAVAGDVEASPKVRPYMLEIGEARTSRSVARSARRLMPLPIGVVENFPRQSVRHRHALRGSL